MSKQSRSKITSFKQKYRSHDIAVTVNVRNVHPQLQLDPQAVAVSCYCWLKTSYGWLAG